MSLLDKYMPPTGGGIGGLWNSGTQAGSNLLGSVGNLGNTFTGWGNAVVYGVVAIIGVAVLLIGYSFASGNQSLGEVAQIAKAIKG